MLRCRRHLLQILGLSPRHSVPRGPVTVSQSDMEENVEQYTQKQPNPDLYDASTNLRKDIQHLCSAFSLSTHVACYKNSGVSGLNLAMLPAPTLVPL